MVVEPFPTYLRSVVVQCIINALDFGAMPEVPSFNSVSGEDNWCLNTLVYMSFVGIK